jgi:hypothetical protein
MKIASFSRLNSFCLLCLGGFVLILGSCSTNEVLEVRQFHLRTTEVESMKEAAMVRGEQMYLMRGAVSNQERRERLGQYYTVNWENGGKYAEPLKIVMEYQQAATGSEVLSMSKDLPVGEQSGVVEFSVAGESYRTRGRVLAWRVQMFSAGKVVAEKRSYLWK